MDNNEGLSPHSHRPGGGNPQLVIITQLLRIITHMHHIDELFLWLLHSIGQRLDIPVIQLWTNQAHATGKYSVELRVMASQNSSLPLYVVNNPQVAEVVKGLLNERHGVRSQPVRSIFLLPQADLLTQHNLHYWESAFLSNNALLPPTSNDTSLGTIPTPLAMIASLFTHQSPNANLLATVTRILEYALSIAKNRGLLLDAASSPFSFSTTSMKDQSLPHQYDLGEIVPHRAQNIEEIQVSNPLASSVIISDKQAHRLYALINGKRSVTQLMDKAQMDQQELTSALRFLLKQKLVQLSNPRGKPVDPLFLESL